MVFGGIVDFEGNLVWGMSWYVEDGKGRGYQRESPHHPSGLNGEKKLYEAGRGMRVGTALLLNRLTWRHFCGDVRSMMDTILVFTMSAKGSPRFIDFSILVGSGLIVEEEWENI